MNLEIDDIFRMDEETFQEIYGRPVFISLDDESRKMRTFLVATSASTMIYDYSGAKITEISALGLDLTKLGQSNVNTLLIVLLSYQLLNYVWHASDVINEWRTRLTGACRYNGPMLLGQDTILDHPESERGSSLVQWWMEQKTKVNNTHDEVQTLIERARENPMSMDVFNDINEKVSFIKDILTSRRVEESLHRFEKSYRLFKSSQLIKFGVFNIAVPIGIGTAAIAMLVW